MTDGMRLRISRRGIIWGYMEEPSVLPRVLRRGRGGGRVRVREGDARTFARGLTDGRKGPQAENASDPPEVRNLSHQSLHRGQPCGRLAFKRLLISRTLTG